MNREGALKVVLVLVGSGLKQQITCSWRATVRQ